MFGVVVTDNEEAEVSFGRSAGDQGMWPEPHPSGRRAPTPASLIIPLHGYPTSITPDEKHPWIMYFKDYAVILTALYFVKDTDYR